MRKAVTIKSIAEQLNLSRNTVAKALNGQYVPEKTRELVLRKAQEMKYKSLNVNHIESGSKKYRIILVSGKPLNNINYFVPLIKSIENNCFERNLELFQYTYNGSKTTFKEVADYINELKADGIVAIECFDKEFITKLISTDDDNSISCIVKALHKRYNAERFTFVGDFKHCRSFQKRYAGMITGIISVGGTHNRSEDIICNDNVFNYGNAEAVKSEILKLKYRPDCFICCNDFVARSVCNALKLLNVAIPKNTLVTGFDNVSDAVANVPSITSFSVDKEFLGPEAIRTLINRIENPESPSRIITVSTNLTARESTNRII